jgi:hypothetical protein
MLALLSALGCGSSSFFVSSSNGQLLLFISVDPSVADPMHFSGGQVQFTARGMFNMSPSVVSPLSDVIWTIDRPAFSGMPDLGHAFIDQNGVATCAPGFAGTAQVFATAAADPMRALSAQNSKVGTAQLVCP